jgi:hypothetical protein
MDFEPNELAERGFLRKTVLIYAARFREALGKPPCFYGVISTGAQRSGEIPAFIYPVENV